MTYLFHLIMMSSGHAHLDRRRYVDVVYWRFIDVAEN